MQGCWSYCSCVFRSRVGIVLSEVLPIENYSCLSIKSHAFVGLARRNMRVIKVGFNHGNWYIMLSKVLEHIPIHVLPPPLSRVLWKYPIVFDDLSKTLSTL